MSVTVEAPSIGAAIKLRATKHLTFVLDPESCDVSVLKVREIIRPTAITALPQMPDHVRGAINLRGKITPVVDLRRMFGMPTAETTERTCIVVVQVKSDSGALISMGILVDDVEEVANIAAGDIDPTADFGAQMDTAYILGMAKIKGKIKTLLDIDRVITSDTMACLATPAAPAVALTC
ncbi:MAG: purine-binding chemotaxis protein CheW [Verrucomicrobia bacterium]|nr:purine-binding chemotaxis protein CheW [Verrucomicrobiota bacterium]